MRKYTASDWAVIVASTGLIIVVLLLIGGAVNLAISGIAERISP